MVPVGILAASSCGGSLYLSWNPGCGGGFSPRWMLSTVRPDRSPLRDLRSSCQQYAMWPSDAAEVTGTHAWQSLDPCCASRFSQSFVVTVTEFANGSISMSGLCGIKAASRLVNRVYHREGTVSGRPWYSSQCPETSCEYEPAYIAQKESDPDPAEMAAERHKRRLQEAAFGNGEQETEGAEEMPLEQSEEHLEEEEEAFGYGEEESQGAFEHGEEHLEEEEEEAYGYGEEEEEEEAEGEGEDAEETEQDYHPKGFFLALGISLFSLGAAGVFVTTWGLHARPRSLPLQPQDEILFSPQCVGDGSALHHSVPQDASWPPFGWPLRLYNFLGFRFLEWRLNVYVTFRRGSEVSPGMVCYPGRPAAVPTPGHGSS